MYNFLLLLQFLLLLDFVTAVDQLQLELVLLLQRRILSAGTPSKVLTQS